MRIGAMSLLTFIALSFNLLVLPSILPRLFKPPWTIIKEIIWNSWIVMTVSALIIIYYQYLDILDFSFMFVLEAALYGCLSVSVLIVINRDRLLRDNLKTATELNEKIQIRNEFGTNMVFFASEYMKDKLAIAADSILLIRSANNYIEVFWKEGDAVNNKMLRSSLSKTCDLLIDHKYLFRCHRSYVINVEKIIKIEGNYQGYKISLSDIDFSIPVSESYKSRLQELI
ncbi:MAG: LytTR family DNA-binding domain-containing protein [Candidatus Kapabacteria bacterium]|nr:LytTR family DNA-binding domain-containing protein [Candidatus Kapabacteria bacterium]